MSVTISADQRNALYRRLLDQLRGFDDLLKAVDDGEIETAYRLGRRLTDALSLIQEELGWGEEATGEWELRKIPPKALARTLARIRDDALTQYEREREEQEEFRSTWDQAALVLETCDFLIPLLSRSSR
jgi:hypothetical protein